MRILAFSKMQIRKYGKKTIFTHGSRPYTGRRRFRWRVSIMSRMLTTFLSRGWTTRCFLQTYFKRHFKRYLKFPFRTCVEKTKWIQLWLTRMEKRMSSRLKFNIYIQLRVKYIYPGRHLLEIIKHFSWRRLSKTDIWGLEWASRRPRCFLHMDERENLLFKGLTVLEILRKRSPRQGLP